MAKPNEVRLRIIQRLTTIITAATLTLTSFRNGGMRLLNCQLAAGQAFTLPAATGKLGKRRLYTGITVTGTTTVKTTGTDILAGIANVAGTVSGTFPTASDTNTLTMNGTTKGGIIGSYIECEDVGVGQWRVLATLTGSGTAVTPFSHT